MYFIHYIQTYASVNRKGSELQSHILKFKDCLLKDRNALDDLKEEIHCRIEELDEIGRASCRERVSPYV